MKFVFLTASTAKEEWHSLAKETYYKKISKFIPIEFAKIEIQKSSRDQANEKKKIESELISKFLKPHDFIVLFDETGKSLSSEKFTDMNKKILMSGKKRAIFIIGGAYGVSDDIKKLATEKVSLAPFVLNHLVAEIVALEQVYRSFTIIKNLPYHNK